MAETDEVTQYEYVRIAEISELPVGERLFVEVDSIPVVVINLAGHLYAIGDICTHDGGPLGDGEIDGCQIICPRHGARFDLRNGKALTLPAVEDTPAFPVRTQGGWIELGVPVRNS